VARKGFRATPNKRIVTEIPRSFESHVLRVIFNTEISSTERSLSHVVGLPLESTDHRGSRFKNSKAYVGQKLRRSGFIGFRRFGLPENVHRTARYPQDLRQFDRNDRDHRHHGKRSVSVSGKGSSLLSRSGTPIWSIPQCSPPFSGPARCVPHPRPNLGGHPLKVAFYLLSSISGLQWLHFPTVFDPYQPL
jgi:hypothetical protein